MWQDCKEIAIAVMCTLGGCAALMVIPIIPIVILLCVIRWLFF